MAGSDQTRLQLEIVLDDAVVNNGSIDRRVLVFFFQAEDGIRDYKVTGVQTCALPISEIQAALARMNVLEDYGPAMRVERAAALYFIDQVRAGKLRNLGNSRIGDEIGRASCRERV